jgi:hypothetical protein
MTQMEDYISIYFKLVRKGLTKTYRVNRFWTVGEMYEQLKPHIEQDFRIPATQIEIVETGQNIPGTFAEDSPALDPRDNTVFWAKFGGKKNVSFYVRNKTPVLSECDNCSEIMHTMTYFGCMHEYCYDCISIYRTSVNDMCPVCKW